MTQKKISLKIKLNAILTTISSFLIPVIQYVPCTAIWFGIMSVPLLYYLLFFFQNPAILMSDIAFLFSSYEIYIILIGLVIYLYTLIYQIKHRKELIQTGPYKYVRHPQYIAIIITTFGMTLSVFQTSPIISPNLIFDAFTIIFLLWIGEVLAYVILAKIEEFALKAKYRDKYLEYANNVSFMIPFLKLRRKNN
ncbi:MAG: methyltransferase family protein [Candidatus Thorarchaeota archaeon]